MTLATIDATLGYLIYALCLWVGLRIVLGLAYCAARGYAPRPLVGAAVSARLGVQLVSACKAN